MSLATPSDIEVFRKVSRHLLRQNRKSVGFDEYFDSISNVCKYRGVDNMKCALGCLIPDEAYDPQFENLRPVDHLKSSKPEDGLAYKLWLVIEELHPGVQHALICDLQDVHDNRDPVCWLSELAMVAKKYGIPTE